MARLYGNENFPQGVAQRLRELGHDILTVLEAGNANLGISDADVLTFAITQQRSVITLDRHDFIRLHFHYQNNHQDHFGIIVCKYDRDVDRQAENIHKAIESIGDLTNQLLRVTRNG
jgi:hypothetical protein